MKTVLILLLSLCLSLPLLGQSAADAAKDAADKVADGVKSGAAEVEEPKITVRGRVYYEETGQPLRRSWIGLVKIRDIRPDPKTGKVSESLNVWEYQNADSVLTNDFGEFIMNDVSPGVYQAVMKVPGILNPRSGDQGSPVFQQFIFDGVTEAQVEIGVKRGGAVSGRVLYQDGAPLIGASVTLFAVKKSDPADVEVLELEPELVEIDGLGTAQTDDRGYYRFAGIPQGEYMVMVAEPSVFDGSNSKVSSYSTFKYFSTSELKTFYPNAKNKLEASRLQVYLGEELRDTDITLAPRELYEVVGRVVGEGTNSLVDGIEVEFIKEGETGESDYSSRSIRTTTTDKEGLWKFKDMLPGKYTAKVSEPSYRRYRDEEDPAPTRPNYATSEHKFEIMPGERSDVILRIAVEGTIRGTVSVEGNAELPDTVSINADTSTERVSSDSPETTDYESDESRQKVRATFTLDDLRAGEYFLSVKASDGHYAKSITMNGSDIMNKPVEIKAGEALGKINVVLTTGAGTVEGKVLNADSSDYLYAELMPVDPGIGLYRAYLMSDSDYIADEGSFEIQAKPGEYYLFVRKGTESAPVRDATPEKLDAWVRELIKNAIRVRLERGKTLEINISKPE